MPSQNHGIYEFGRFRLDAGQKVLFDGGRPVELTPKTLDTLLLLVENAGRVVAKETFMQRVWPDASVEDGSLTSQISILRKVLGAAAGERLIETVPKRGYRFAADVRYTAANSAPLVVQETHTFSRIKMKEEESDEPPAAALPAPAARPWRAAGARAVALAAAVLGAVLIGAALVYKGPWRDSGGGPGAGAFAVRSIAVLPFQALDGGADDDYLRLGLSDALTTRLSAVRRLTVRPTSAVIKFRDGGADARAAGRELGVDAVLTGSFQRAGQSARITVQLVAVRDGRALWAQTFDEKLSNIFAVQDSISARVAEELAPQLSGEEKTILDRPHTQDVEADRLYWKGRLLMKQSVRTPETVQKAIGYFREAVERDPDFALAYAGLASAYEGASTLNLMRPHEMFQPAREAVRRALELDPYLSEAHATLGSISWEYEHDWEAGERHLRRALELNPSNSGAHSNYAEMLSMLGRPDEALAENDRAQQIDPLSSNIRAVRALILYHARRYEEAARQAEGTLELDQYSYLARMYLAAACESRGLYSEAVEHVKEARRLSGDDSPDVAMLARMLARAGREAESRVAFEQLRQIARGQYVDPFAFVIVHEALGENAEAMGWLEKAYEERSYWATSLRVNPHLDGLRSEPGFAALVKRLGLAEQRAP